MSVRTSRHSHSHIAIIICTVSGIVPRLLTTDSGRSFRESALVCPMGINIARGNDCGRLWGQQRYGKWEDTENNTQGNTTDQMPREISEGKCPKEKLNKIEIKQCRQKEELKKITSAITITLLTWAERLMYHPLLMSPRGCTHKAHVCVFVCINATTTRHHIQCSYKFLRTCN